MGIGAVWIKEETKDGLHARSEFTNQAEASAHVNASDVAILINGDVDAARAKVHGDHGARMNDAHGGARSLEGVDSGAGGVDVQANKVLGGCGGRGAKGDHF